MMDHLTYPTSKSAYYRHRQKALLAFSTTKRMPKIRSYPVAETLTRVNLLHSLSSDSRNQGAPVKSLDCFRNDGDTCSTDDHCSPPEHSSSSSSTQSIDSCSESPDIHSENLWQRSPLKMTLREGLKSWAISNNVSNSTVTKLLKLLKDFNCDVPGDSRALLRVTRDIALENMGSGQYYYFGLKCTICTLIKQYLPNLKSLSVNFNIHGMPIFRSSSTEFYPILVQINLPGVHVRPAICAAYFGPTKPAINDFLKDFAPELKELLQRGIVLGNQSYEIRMGFFVCDAPAREWVKSVKSHTGYYGCDRCTQKGVWLNRITFPETKAPLRTDESFCLKAQKKHHNGFSPLSDNPKLGMVSDFVADPLHVVYLGVMRKLCQAWCKGQKVFKNERHHTRRDRAVQQKSSSLQGISRKLLKAKRYWPSELSRKPRSLAELDRWKGTEFRQFLLYLGPVVLKKVLKPELYQHFMILHAAITILSHEDTHLALNAVAKKLILKFVINCKTLYKDQFISYNVHSLVHIPSDCLRFGPLDSFSGFAFENELQSIKRMIRGESRPLHQLVGRVIEQSSSIEERGNDCSENKCLLSSRHTSYYVAGLQGCQFKTFIFHGQLISTKEGDNAVLLHDKTVVIVLNFVVTDSETWLVGQKFGSRSTGYTAPIDSSDLHIYTVKQLRMRPLKWPVSDIQYKMLLVPRHNGFMAYPLVNPN